MESQSPQSDNVYPLDEGEEYPLDKEGVEAAYGAFCPMYDDSPYDFVESAIIAYLKVVEKKHAIISPSNKATDTD